MTAAAPRKPRVKAKSKPVTKVNGPRIPGAEERPVIGRMRKPDDIPSRRGPKKKKPTRAQEKDPVFMSERHTNKQVALLTGENSRNLALRRMNRLKELIEPTTPSLIQVMSDIAHDKKVHAAIRLDAADRLLNRVYGKPKEHVVLEDPEDGAEVNQDEVVKLLNNILESVGAPPIEKVDNGEEGPTL